MQGRLYAQHPAPCTHASMRHPCMRTHLVDALRVSLGVKQQRPYLPRLAHLSPGEEEGETTSVYETLMRPFELSC